MISARVGDEVLVLRDYHIDNMMVLPGRADLGDRSSGFPGRGDRARRLRRCLADPSARRDLSTGLEETVQRYLDARPDLEAAAYWRSHALLGAQRVSRSSAFSPAGP